jgi:UDP-N-acetylmuramate--alanine ligase
MLLDEFATAFGDADHVLVTTVYAAREKDTLGVSGADIVALMDHADAQYLTTSEGAVATLLDRVQPGDVVITLGAGDSYEIGERVLEVLRNGEDRN